MEPDPLLTFAAVAKLEGVSPHTVSKWVDAGAIIAVRPADGSFRRIRQSELQAFRLRMHRANDANHAKYEMPKAAN